ncbi:hypothetical protein C8255_13065 [filamentous cyanobacterium CCP3]|nr:hypothetical protein C8255_13065 [filamentous cyanobacterium CCP3]
MDKMSFGNNGELVSNYIAWEAIQIVYDYESQSVSDIANLDLQQFASHLMHDRWSQLGPSPEYVGPTGGDR